MEGESRDDQDSEKKMGLQLLAKIKQWLSIAITWLWSPRDGVEVVVAALSASFVADQGAALQWSDSGSKSTAAELFTGRSLSGYLPMSVRYLHFCTNMFTLAVLKKDIKYTIVHNFMIIKLQI